MKTTILRAVLVIALAAMTLLADGGKNKRGQLSDLGLTGEQQTQVETIMKEQREELQAARKNNASREEMRAIAGKTKERLSGVLNEEQMKKFEANTKQRRGRRGPKV
jgi:Spy/CpxP family protein refolding chaperone